MDLVGRDFQLKCMDEAWRRTERDQGVVVLVSGAVGHGKTQVMCAFAERVKESGCLLAYGRGSRTEIDFPWGVVRQIFSGADFAESEIDIKNLLGGGVSTPEVLDGLARMLFGVMENRRGVIFLDDAQHLDELSRDFLFYLARRSHAASLTLVIGWQEGLLSAQSVETDRMIYAQLHSRDNCVRVVVDSLPREQTRALADQRLGSEHAGLILDDLQRVSGGNPLLIDALIEDHQAARHDAQERPVERVVGEAFTRGLLTVLHRSGPEILAVASALAVLGGPSSSELLSRMTEIAPDRVAAAIRVMERVGILESGMFRHPLAEAAVLEGITSEDRSDGHRRAALLLRGEGADPVVVAGHLVASGRTDDSWSMTMLLEAANQALEQGCPESARTFLEAGYVTAGDRGRRAVVLAQLLRLECRSTLGVSQYLTELADDVLDGRLMGKDAVLVVSLLLLHGRVSSAQQAIARLAAAGPEVSIENSQAVAALRSLVPALYPALRPDFGDDPGIRFPSGHIQGMDLLLDAILGRFEPDAVSRAERMIDQQEMSEDSPVALFSSLLVLTYADRPELADRCCTRALEMLTPGRPTIWRSLIHAAAAENALRRGRLVEAEKHAEEALRQMGVPGWGVLAGLPLGTLASAQTLLGRFEEATQTLALRVPDMMFETPFGLNYLQARGRHHLAVGLPQRAVDDFQVMGTRLAQWGADSSPIASWRTEIARALLQLGEREQSTRHLRDELHRLGDEPSRARGHALRLLAGTLASQERPVLLRESVEALQHSGDRLELVAALNDLHAVCRSRGWTGEARSLARRANRVHKEIRSGTGHLTTSNAEPDADRPLRAKRHRRLLSEAEHRVAELAAQGRTNREIAEQLYVTASTVEQHLTRIYRKLEVGHRSGLAAYFPAEVGIGSGGPEIS